jgi:hypothetical protein
MDPVARPTDDKYNGGCRVCYASSALGPGLSCELVFLRLPKHKAYHMTKKPQPSQKRKKKPAISHPGMMGDGTEEQNLGERGNPAARIKKKDVSAAFGKQRPTR